MTVGYKMERKRKIWFSLFFSVFVLGIIYSFAFQKRYPEIIIDRISLYGANNVNLKDFIIGDNGLLISQSTDPWISYSLDVPTPVAYIQIDTSNVNALSGRLHIFDADSWKDKSGILKNGLNGYYFFNKSNPWITQKFRFDLLEVVGATCRINTIVINPTATVWLIGFVRISLPLCVLLLVSCLTLCNINSIIKFYQNNIRSNVNYSFIIFILCLIVSYFVLQNLRIKTNSTNCFIASILIFILFYIHIRQIKGVKNNCLVLIFSLLLSMANSLGSHVMIAQAPYNDLMDKSYISPYGLNDIIGIIAMVIIIYRCVLAIINIILYIEEKISKNNILFARQISFNIPMLIIFVCWLPYFILYYPGFIFGDSVDQIKQAIGTTGFSNHHPFFHTLLIQICIKIGEMYSNLNFGCAIYTIFQMLYISYALSKIVEWLSQNRVPSIFLFMITIAYAVIPYFGQTSIAMWKDPSFGASLVLLTISMLEFNSEESSVNKNKCLAKIGLFALLACLLRNNGIYAIVFTIFVALITNIYRKKSLKLVANLFAVICLYFVITGPVYSAFEVVPTEKVEKLGICINQMASVAASNDGIMSEKERNFMNNILPIEKYKKTYRPCAVDLLKWNPNFNSDYLNSPEFFKIYISMGLKNPRKYVCAWALMTFGYWAPNRWELNNDSGTLSKGNFNDVLVSGLPIKAVDPNALPDNFLYKVFTVQGSILSLGIVDWILLFSVLVMLLKHDTRGLIAISVSVGVMITLIIASPYWYWQRYGMAQYYLLPVYLYVIIYNLKYYKKIIK